MHCDIAVHLLPWYYLLSVEIMDHQMSKIVTAYKGKLCVQVLLI